MYIQVAVASERNGAVAPWMKKYKLTKQEVAQILEDFLEGRGHPLSWNNFTLGMTLEDEYLDEIRERCTGLGSEFPPEHPNKYCNEEGFNVIRQYIKELRRTG